MSTEINIAPTWAWTVNFYMQVLQNPKMIQKDKREETIKIAKEEILKLATSMDKIIEQGKDVETYYFLFGGNATKCYDEEGFEGLKKFIEEDRDIWDLGTFIPIKDHPGNLLGEYDGYTGFIGIKEEEYKTLLKIKHP